MLDELSDIIRPSHFIGRLNDKRFEIAIPAEAELGLVWAANALGGFEPEPEWFSDSNKRPEGVSNALVPGTATVFDVKAISDRVIPGNVGMRKISRKLMEAASKAKKGTGNKLDFFFYERRDYEYLVNHRAICAPPHYAPSTSVLNTIGDFVRSHPQEGQYIDISDSGMIVRVTWKPEVSKLFNFRSSTVNEIFDIHDNHITAALREKTKQMRSPNFAGLRGVLLVDIGCASLKQINGIDQLGRSFSGRKIIQHYIDNSKSALDFVCVFSPKQKRSFLANSHYYWQVTVIVRQGLDMPMSGLQALASKLPAPRFDGYALEHLHEQKLFRNQARGWYVGTTMTSKNNPDSELNVKFSARALHEFLAGRITGDRLREHIIGGAGAFDYQLAKGNTIREAKIISGDIDEDDDYIELVFAPDAAASPYK